MTDINELTAKLKNVARHSVDGYGRQDICYNDPEGEFVFYSDYEALTEALEAAENRIAELEARTLTVKLPDVEKWRSVDAVRAQSAYKILASKDIAEAFERAGIKLQIEGE